MQEIDTISKLAMNDQPSIAKQPEVELGVKVIAFLLIAGGLLGIGISVVGFIAMPQATLGSPLMAAFALLYLLLFGWSVWIGFDLWQGEPRGYRWAEILLFAQIPNIRISGFVYQFQTAGFTIRWLSGQAGRGINFNFGSHLSIYVSPEIQGTALGVNIVAIFALIYLLRVTSPDYEVQR